MKFAALVLVMTIVLGPFASADQTCREVRDDAEVLETVFRDLVFPRLKPGAVLLAETGAKPQFPATISQLEQQQAIIEKLDGQTQSDEREFRAAFVETPRGVDLEIGDQRKIPKEMVDNAYNREGCPLPEIQIEGVDLRRFRPSEIPSTSDFWGSLLEKYGTLGGLVFMALPAYSSDKTQAVVSYHRMHGPVGGMGETIYLRLVDGSWTIIWHATTFVS